MSKFIDGNYKTFTAGGAISQYLRVKLAAGVLAIATATDLDLGVIRDAAFAAGDFRAVRLRTCNGTSIYVASGAIALGAKVYSDANGLVTGTPVAGAIYLGDAMEVATANGDFIEVLHHGYKGAALGLSSITFAAAAGAAASNICNVTLQVVDGAGNALPGVYNLDVWLSDAATGAGLTATAASGTVVGTTGQDLGDYTAKKAKRIQTSAAGTYVLQITDAAKTHFYVAAVALDSNVTVVSAQLLTANYG